MTIYKRDLTVPPDDIFDVHEFLRNVWEEKSSLSETDRYSIETAIIELTSNIFQYSEVAGRIACNIVIEIEDEKVSVTITDNGELAVLELDEHIMPDEFSESGRGIALIRALVDEFTFDTTENKNQWRLSKRIQL